MLRFVLPLVLLAVPAAAATHRFDARLAAPAPAARLVSSDLLWQCDGALCAAHGPIVDVPRRLCSRLARDGGRLRSFAVNGVGFDVDQLEACNARANRLRRLAAGG